MKDVGTKTSYAIHLESGNEMELELKVFHLQTLYEIAQALNACRNSSSIYKEVLSILMGTFGVEYGLALIASNQDGWQVAAERGFGKQVCLSLEDRLAQSSFEARSAESKKKFLIHYVRKQNKRNLTEATSVWVEFLGRENVLGGIFLGKKLSGEVYSQADQDLLEAVASHVTTALENLRLYEQLKDAQQRLQLENIALREQVQKEYAEGRIIGQSAGIRKLMNQVRNVARSPTNVLIYGETGTGKELIAKTIHYHSPRKDNPFVAVNSTAIPENLVESELFGIEAGVATGVKKHIGYFEQADGGTLFIDEIGDMPLSSQAKILRVLQERSFRRVGGTKETTVDVRVIAATNKNLEQEMKKGNFREDLFFRLSVLELHIPPLRERRDDIPLLVNHFIKKYRAIIGTNIRGLSAKAMLYLAQYDWPGNIRELENEIEKLTTLAHDDAVIQPEDLSHKITHAEPLASASEPEYLSSGILQEAAHQKVLQKPAADSLRGALDDVERRLICEALERYRWNKSEVARKLGISRLGLQKKIERLGIEQRS